MEMIAMAPVMAMAMAMDTATVPVTGIALVQGTAADVETDTAMGTVTDMATATGTDMPPFKYTYIRTISDAQKWISTAPPSGWMCYHRGGCIDTRLGRAIGQMQDVLNLLQFRVGDGDFLYLAQRRR